VADRADTRADFNHAGNSLTHLSSAAGLSVADAAPGLRDTYQKTMRKTLIWASVAKKYQISVIALSAGPWPGSVRGFPMASRSVFFALAISSSVLTAGVVLLPSAAQALTTWNWSFTTPDADQFGAGTFTSADAVPTANAPITITGISGTYNRGGRTYGITGLDNFNRNNIIVWDGTPSSSLMANGDVDNFQGVAFETDGGRIVQLVYRSSAARVGPISDHTTSFSGLDAFIVSSSLNPVAPPDPVPGPLPLVGAAAAFGWTRKLRRRISASTFRF
jgi:hypothetical protein